MLKAGDKVRHKTENGHGTGEVKAAYRTGVVVVLWPDWVGWNGMTEEEATGAYYAENLVPVGEETEE